MTRTRFWFLLIIVPCEATLRLALKDETSPKIRANESEKESSASSPSRFPVSDTSSRNLTAARQPTQALNESTPLWRDTVANIEGTECAFSNAQNQSLLPVRFAGDVEFINETHLMCPQIKSESFRALPIMIVMARYLENITWIMNQGVKTVIVNRGPAVSIPSPGNDNITVNRDKNIGRESAVYLKYILQQYDAGDFADVMVFCQATPHQPKEQFLEFVRRLGKIGSNPNETIEMKSMAEDKSDQKRWHSNVSNPTLWERDFRKYGFTSLGRREFGRDKNALARPEEKKKDIFKEFMPGCDISSVSVNVALHGCMAVTRDRILSNQKEWYQRWLDHFPKQENNPEIGAVCELAWPCIFVQPGGEGSLCPCPARSEAGRGTQ